MHAPDDSNRDAAETTAAPVPASDVPQEQQPPPLHTPAPRPFDDSSDDNDEGHDDAGGVENTGPRGRRRRKATRRVVFAPDDQLAQASYAHDDGDDDGALLTLPSGAFGRVGDDDEGAVPTAADSAGIAASSASLHDSAEAPEIGDGPTAAPPAASAPDSGRGAAGRRGSHPAATRPDGVQLLHRYDVRDVRRVNDGAGGAVPAKQLFSHTLPRLGQPGDPAQRVSERTRLGRSWRGALGKAHYVRAVLHAEIAATVQIVKAAAPSMPDAAADEGAPKAAAAIVVECAAAAEIDAVTKRYTTFASSFHRTSVAAADAATAPVPQRAARRNSAFTTGSASAGSGSGGDGAGGALPSPRDGATGQFRFDQHRALQWAFLHRQAWGAQHGGGGKAAAAAALGDTYLSDVCGPIVDEAVAAAHRLRDLERASASGAALPAKQRLAAVKASAAASGTSVKFEPVGGTSFVTAQHGALFVHVWGCAEAGRRVAAGLAAYNSAVAAATAGGRLGLVAPVPFVAATRPADGAEVLVLPAVPLLSAVDPATGAFRRGAVFADLAADGDVAGAVLELAADAAVAAHVGTTATAADIRAAAAVAQQARASTPTWRVACGMDAAVYVCDFRTIVDAFTPWVAIHPSGGVGRPVTAVPTWALAKLGLPRPVAVLPPATAAPGAGDALVRDACTEHLAAHAPGLHAVLAARVVAAAAALVECVRTLKSVQAAAMPPPPTAAGDAPAAAGPPPPNDRQAADAAAAGLAADVYDLFRRRVVPRAVKAHGVPLRLLFIVGSTAAAAIASERRDVVDAVAFEQQRVLPSRKDANARLLAGFAPDPQRDASNEQRVEQLLVEAAKHERAAEALRLVVAAEMVSRSIKWAHRAETAHSAAANARAGDDGAGTLPSMAARRHRAELLNRLLYAAVAPTYDAWLTDVVPLVCLKYDSASPVACRFGRPPSGVAPVQALAAAVMQWQAGHHPHSGDDGLRRLADGGACDGGAWVTPPAAFVSWLCSSVHAPVPTRDAAAVIAGSDAAIVTGVGSPDAPALTTLGAVASAAGRAMGPLFARCVTTYMATCLQGDGIAYSAACSKDDLAPHDATSIASAGRFCVPQRFASAQAAQRVAGASSFEVTHDATGEATRTAPPHPILRSVLDRIQNRSDSDANANPAVALSERAPAELRALCTAGRDAAERAWLQRVTSTAWVGYLSARGHLEAAARAATLGSTVTPWASDMAAIAGAASDALTSHHVARRTALQVPLAVLPHSALGAGVASSLLLRFRGHEGAASQQPGSVSPPAALVVTAPPAAKLLDAAPTPPAGPARPPPPAAGGSSPIPATTGEGSAAPPPFSLASHLDVATRFHILAAIGDAMPPGPAPDGLLRGEILRTAVNTILADALYGPLYAPTNTLYLLRQHVCTAASSDLETVTASGRADARVVQRACEAYAAVLAEHGPAMQRSAQAHSEKAVGGWHRGHLLRATRAITRAAVAAQHRYAAIARSGDATRSSSDREATLQALSHAVAVAAANYAPAGLALFREAFGDEDAQTAVALTHYATLVLHPHRDALTAASVDALDSIAAAVAATGGQVTVADMERLVQSDGFAENLAQLGEGMLDAGLFNEQDCVVATAERLLALSGRDTAVAPAALVDAQGVVATPQQQSTPPLDDAPHGGGDETDATAHGGDAPTTTDDAATAHDHDASGGAVGGGANDAPSTPPTAAGKEDAAHTTPGASAAEHDSDAVGAGNELGTAQAHRPEPSEAASVHGGPPDADTKDDGAANITEVADDVAATTPAAATDGSSGNAIDTAVPQQQQHATAAATSDDAAAAAAAPGAALAQRNPRIAALLARRQEQERQARTLQAAFHGGLLKQPDRVARRYHGQHAAFAAGCVLLHPTGLHAVALLEVQARESIERAAIIAAGVALSAPGAPLALLRDALVADAAHHAAMRPYLALYAAQVAQDALERALAVLVQDEAAERARIAARGVSWFDGAVRRQFIKERLLARNINRYQADDARRVEVERRQAAAAEQVARRVGGAGALRPGRGRSAQGATPPPEPVSKQQQHRGGAPPPPPPPPPSPPPKTDDDDRRARLLLELQVRERHAAEVADALAALATHARAPPPAEARAPPPPAPAPASEDARKSSRAAPTGTSTRCARGGGASPVRRRPAQGDAPPQSLKPDRAQPDARRDADTPSSATAPPQRRAPPPASAATAAARDTDTATPPAAAERERLLRELALRERHAAQLAEAVAQLKQEHAAVARRAT